MFLISTSWIGSNKKQYHRLFWMRLRRLMTEGTTQLHIAWSFANSTACNRQKLAPISFSNKSSLSSYTSLQRDFWSTSTVHTTSHNYYAFLLPHRYCCTDDIYNVCQRVWKFRRQLHH